MILIVDFGSQTAHLIGRRLRQIGVQTEYTNPEDALATAKKLKPNGIILSGGPSSVYDSGAPTVEKEIFELGIPVLGICYGWQVMAYLLGGKVKNTSKEYGPEKLELRSKNQESRILKKVPKESTVIVSHGDTVTTLPKGFENLAETQTVTYSAVENTKDQLGILLVKTDAVVFNTEQPVPVSFFDSDMNSRRGFATVFDRIADQVLKELYKLYGIPIYDWQ